MNTVGREEERVASRHLAYKDVAGSGRPASGPPLF